MEPMKQIYLLIQNKNGHVERIFCAYTSEEDANKARKELQTRLDLFCNEVEEWVCNPAAASTPWPESDLVGVSSINCTLISYTVNVVDFWT